MTYVLTPGLAGRTVPLIYSSPHSGREYPGDWALRITPCELRRGEDAYVDDLLAGSDALGVALLAAQAPRCYIDLNRDVDDIDAELLASPWPGHLNPTEKSRLGLGLIRRFVVPGLEINAGTLSVEDVQHRIETIYHPYHARLAAELDALKARFGTVWMVDWHSMKSAGNAMTPDGAGARRPDFVVGDLDGTSAAADFTTLAVTTLESFGYSVALNRPYKGGTITRRYGRPDLQQHTIQIEINRALYLNEVTVEKTDGFAPLRQNLRLLTESLGRAASIAASD